MNYIFCRFKSLFLVLSSLLPYGVLYLVLDAALVVIPPSPRLSLCSRIAGRFSMLVISYRVPIASKSTPSYIVSQTDVVRLPQRALAFLSVAAPNIYASCIRHARSNTSRQSSLRAIHTASCASHPLMCNTSLIPDRGSGYPTSTLHLLCGVLPLILGRAIRHRVAVSARSRPLLAIV